MRILAADHLLPICHAPVTDAAIAIDGDIIIGVGKRRDVITRFSGAKVTDFGEAAIMPGFVNCHSHLELTHLRGGLDEVEHDFTQWLIRLNAMRSAMPDEQIREAAVLGATEGARAGVTCFGDIGRMAFAGLHALRTVGQRGVVYQETEFSPDDRTAEGDFKTLALKYESLRAEETNLVKVGLSPHAPYTVSSRLFELIAQYSILNRIPIAIHASESADEHELLTSGTGFFTAVYEKYDVEWHSPFCTPIEYLERIGVLSARPLLAHCVTASESDLSRIAATGSKIAHCPKSNAKFGHGYAPFENMIDAGIAVGLGSDSVASNNLCDLLEEGRFAALVARNRPGTRRPISAREILRTATLGGAEALGMEDMIGSLDPGKQADIAVIALSAPAHRPINDAEAAIVFSSNARDVLATFVAGQQIY